MAIVKHGAATESDVFSAVGANQNRCKRWVNIGLTGVSHYVHITLVYQGSKKCFRLLYVCHYGARG